MRGYDSSDLIWENYSLSFIGQECRKIPLYLADSFGRKAKRLDLSSNSLHTLSGLDRFIVLEELILDNNDLDDSTVFPQNFRLNTISLNKNKFVNLEKLVSKLSTAFPNLRYLSLLGNKACPDQLTNVEDDEKDYSRYRLFVLSKLPKLKFLDSSMITKTEKQEAARVGSYMKVIRPDDELFNETQNDGDFLPYSPLPATDYNSQIVPKGAYGRLKYKYTGKHSEGNRFISNNHL